MRLRSGYTYSNYHNITACQDCYLCKGNFLDTNIKYINRITKEQFEVEEQFTCQSKRIIYLISCRICNIQYVGQTKSCLKNRFSGHRSGLKNGNEPKHVLNHFTKVHQPSDMIIKPLIFVKKEDNLNDIENEVILKLNTLYPYGLNDRLEKPRYLDAQKTFNENGCIYKLFPCVQKRSCLFRKRGSRKNRRNSDIDIDVLFLDLKLHYDSYDIRFIRNKIASCSKDICCKLGKYISEKKSRAKFCHYYVLYDIIIDLCNHYRLRELDFDQFFEKKTVRLPETIEYIPFRLKNKSMNDINFNKILNDCKQYLPLTKLPKRFSKDDFKLQATFSYVSPIRSKVFNYNNLKCDNDRDFLTCNCNSLYSDFVDNSVGHVVTGDLKFIKHRKLRNILSMGSKFRETIACSEDSVNSSISKDIDEYIDNIRLRYSLNKDSFKSWKEEVLNDIKAIISRKNVTFDGK